MDIRQDGYRLIAAVARYAFLESFHRIIDQIHIRINQTVRVVLQNRQEVCDENNKRWLLNAYSAPGYRGIAVDLVN